MLSDKELEQIRDQFSNSANRLKLTFHPSSSDETFSSMLAQVVEAAVKAAGGGVELERGEGEDVLATPAVTVTGAGRGAISYLALPVDREAPPFVEALQPESRGAAEGPLTRLREIEQPAQVWVFMAQSCPHCPEAVRAANRLARSSDKISATIIDAQRFADLAARFNIQSVPATVIDQQLTLTGVMPAEKLLEKIAARNTPQFQASVLLSMIESSRFEDAAAHVLGDGGAADFLALWSRSTTSSRMGLLMVVEKVLAKNPEALHGVVEGFIDLLKREDAALRGDTADLLGQIGHIRAKPALEALLSDPNPDVADIAAEALEALE
jgi:alkyl hydroperoxide reductase subunit AhpF